MTRPNHPTPTASTRPIVTRPGASYPDTAPNRHGATQDRHGPTQDRVAQLSARFRTHAVGRRPENTRTRERQSLYLDTEVVARAATAYRDLAHAAYPHTISKSAFWETALEYALDHLPDLTARLLPPAEPESPAP